VKQYQLEERSLIAARARVERVRLSELLAIMRPDEISDPDEVATLREELAAHHRNRVFFAGRTMSELVDANINLVLHNEFRQSTPGS
jgi:hypothetical protein